MADALIKAKDLLPKTSRRLDNATLVTLLKHFAAVPMPIEECLDHGLPEKYAQELFNRSVNCCTSTCMTRTMNQAEACMSVSDHGGKLIKDQWVHFSGFAHRLC